MQNSKRMKAAEQTQYVTKVTDVEQATWQKMRMQTSYVFHDPDVEKPD